MQLKVRGDSFADDVRSLWCLRRSMRMRFRWVERDGYAWVYVPAAGAGRVEDSSGLPPVPEVPKFWDAVSERRI